MYLAKFFHRPPGDDDRELLLCLGDQPKLMGLYMRDEHAEFLNEDFSSQSTAVAAFRRAAAALRRAGYMETAHTDYTLRNLLPDPPPKPEWQRGLDELMLSVLGDDLATQEACIASLVGTPAESEPLYLWLAAHHRVASEGRDALALAQKACDAIASRKAGQLPFYAWSIRHHDLEARIYEVLCRAHLAGGDAGAALDAIEQAYEVMASQDRGALRAWILCEHFPERRDEAFDAAYRYAEFGGFEAITALPAYADYVQRRRKKTKADKGWRWSTHKKPASERDLRELERELGIALPRDYRDFLAKRGRTDLQIRLREESSDLRFYGASELVRQRDDLIDFITRGSGSGEAEAYFGEQYGVSLRDLVPIAEPTHFSRCILIHLAQGERFGWCYRWDHDGAWELEDGQPSFQQALAALTAAIERREEMTLSFLGVAAQ
jgi:hypothetical protein